MSEFGENLKNIVKKSMAVIGNKATDLAANAKQKVDAFNLTNRKNDLFSMIGRKIYELSVQGGAIPEGLEEELKEIVAIDKELEQIAREKNDSHEDAPCSEELNNETDTKPETDNIFSKAAEYTAQDNTDVPVIEISSEEDKSFEDCPLSSAINDLFEKIPPVDKMMDKVNSSLDELGDNLKKFSTDFDRQLNEFTDKMMNGNDKDHNQS